MVNVKLTVAYEGTEFLGWQETQEGPSIEGALRHALAQILQHPVSLQAASRTDAGVHAEKQIVNFHTEKAIDPRRLRRGCNALLPPSIVVTEVAAAPETFHPTLDVRGKVYLYRVSFGPVQLPFERHHAWHVPENLDIDIMRQAARDFLGTRDFATLCNFRKDLQYKTTVRTLTEIDIRLLAEGRLAIEVRGDHFLYKMVRNIVGTLIDIGRGKLPADAVPDILAAKHRPVAGVTAPAHGLTLKEVIY